MSELPIPAEAIEIALQEFYACPPTDEADDSHKAMERAFRRGLEAMGVQVERLGERAKWRLVSRWLPVEQDER